jgi:hypothetical protein
MIVSHSEELHYPVKLDLKRTEYYEATLEVDFKASTLNNAIWEVLYHDSEQIEMISYDPHAISFAADLLEYLNGNRPVLELDGDNTDYTLDITDDTLTVLIRTDPFEALVCEAPYDVETTLEVQ